MIKNVRTGRWVIVMLVLSALLSACGGQPQPARVAASVFTPEPTAMDVPILALPTPPHTPAATATAAATATSTPTPTPLNPLSIEAILKRDYSGSDIVIEQTLAAGVNYNQYIASYKSEGLKIYALLTVPMGPKPKTGWPVIIFNHGFIPPAQYRTTERYVAYVEALARNGYIVFKSDYRGHGSSEGRATGGEASPDYTIDVLNAVSSMQRYQDADPNRIGMWGHSMGYGYIARDGREQRHQGRCDLGRRRRFLSGFVLQVAHSPRRYTHTPPGWPAMARGFDRAVWDT